MTETNGKPTGKKGHPKGKPRDPSKLCGAKRAGDGQPCRAYALANGRCKNHGGATPVAAESGSFKSGKYSKYMPKKIQARYEAAANDPNLLALDDEIGMLTVLIEETLLEHADHPEDMNWGAIVGLIERKRRLVDTERKRREVLLTNMTVEQAVSLVRAVEGIIRMRVKDADVVEAIAGDFAQLLGP